MMMLDYLQENEFTPNEEFTDCFDNGSVRVCETDTGWLLIIFTGRAGRTPVAWQATFDHTPVEIVTAAIGAALRAA